MSEKSCNFTKNYVFPKETHKQTMKRSFLFYVAITLSISVFSQLYAPLADISGNLHGYKYVYVVPTSGITSNAGGGSVVKIGNLYSVYSSPTKTISPAETIKGYLMQMGYTILPNLNPSLANQTLVVSYGHMGRRAISVTAYASGIVIQMSNAKTNKVLATFQAEGCGRDETEDITQAIYSVKSFFIQFAPQIYCRNRTGS